MEQMKLKVMFAFPSYGGNGGIASEVPQIRQWMMSLGPKMKGDPRIDDEIVEVTRADTPITMVRNEFVKIARAKQVDVLVMVDSDINPILHEGEPGIKDFFESSFDFLYNHYSKGPCVIGSPYCGPPHNRGQNCYVFEWQNYGEQSDEVPFTLEMVPRMMAAKKRGIQEAGALPTGLIMYDMRAFRLIEPSRDRAPEVLEQLMKGKISKDEALIKLHDGWFYYEWEDQTASKKASTEDVTNTRDISLAGQAALGYNPMYCNWDAPVGHWKPWCVPGRPNIHDANSVASSFRKAVLDKNVRDEVIVDASQLRQKGAQK